jgi:N-acetylglucosamine repressor
MKGFPGVRQQHLLALLSDPRGTSRIDLARRLGRSPSKIGGLVRRILELGLVTEERTVETARGRRPILLRPAPDLGYLLGIDIGLVNLRAVVTDLRGEVIGSTETLSNARTDLDTAVRSMLAATDSLLFESRASRDKLRAIGISHSGGIDPKTGVCLYWHSARHWKGVPLRQMFVDRYGVPATVDDSAHCMALAERMFGRAQDQEDFVFINIGQGIGAGLFLKGQLYKGSSGVAGEFGHCIINPDGPRCSCGNHGCLEAVASGGAMMETAVAAVKDNVTTALWEAADRGEPITIQAISAAARAGDRLARKILGNAAAHMGLGIANLINLLNPPLIILGGGCIETAGDLLLEDIIRSASGAAFEAAYSNTRILPSELDGMAAARGAALMVTQPALESIWNQRVRASKSSAALLSA